MQLTIKIKMDNAAFGEAPGCEVARILRKWADEMEDITDFCADQAALRDYNGNVCGSIKITE